MKKVDTKLLSLAEYARHRGCSRTAVSKAVKEGRISLTDGQIDPVAADATWQARTRPRADTKAPAAPPVEVGPADADMTYVEAKRREAVANARMAERAAATQAGKLADVDLLVAAMSRRFGIAREIALSVPSRLAPLVAAESDIATVARMLADEMHRMLDEISDVAYAVRKASA